MRAQEILPATAVLAAVALSGCTALGLRETPTAEVGECVETASFADQLGGAEAGELSEIPTVDCAEPHDGEVLLTYDLPEGAFPGQEAIDGVVDSQCKPQFETYLGSPWEESQRFDLFTVYPTEQSWGSGDREVLCIVYTMDGSTVTGTFEGAESDTGGSTG